MRDDVPVGYIGVIPRHVLLRVQWYSTGDGGRQMYLQLEVGDSAHLHCNDSFIVSVIHFCVKLDYPIM